MGRIRRICAQTVLSAAVIYGDAIFLGNRCRLFLSLADRLIAVCCQLLCRILRAQQAAQRAVCFPAVRQFRLDEDHRDAKLLLKRVQIRRHIALDLSHVDDNLRICLDQRLFI